MNDETVAPALPVWQPIKTAPKDNKRMLLLALFYEGTMTDLDYGGRWMHNLPGWAMGCVWFSVNGIDKPTHWMYQPDSPK